MLGNVQFSGFSPPTQSMVIDPKWIKARVIVKKLYDDDEDQDWPQYFLAVPQKGNQIRTSGGRTLDVFGVVHASVNGQPEIQIEIGVASDFIIPTEGGGASDGFM